MTLTSHQQAQQKIITKLESQIKTDSLSSTTVPPLEDYEHDKQLCLTSVHFFHPDFINKVQVTIDSLRKIEPNFFYYSPDLLHTTIKNVRVIHDPPNFDEADIAKAKKVFSAVIPQHQQFNVYIYRLLLLPRSLILVGTTDPELDKIIFALDKALSKNDLADDKHYINEKYFFCHVTLARFNTPPSADFKQRVLALSEQLDFEPYTVDSVTLLSSNAVLKKQNIIGSWKLKKV